jgi:hypothetical protein
MKTRALLYIVLALVWASCSDDNGPEECATPVAFMGAPPNAIRYEQLSRRAHDTGVRVMLQPGDAGHRFRVYPTTSSDVWDVGGSISFVDANDEVIYEATDLCVAEFATGDWTVPGSAVAVDLEFPNDTIAAILFTVVIET